MLQAHGLGRSDVGRVRTQNEDSFVVDDALGLYAVSDGMGGHAGGEVASRTAIEAVVAYVKAHHDELDAIEDATAIKKALADIAETAVSQAARLVYDLATSPKGQSGMGCTLTVMLLWEGHGAMAHVGDSRLYQLRGSRVSQLSHDHTMIAEMVRNGVLTAEAGEKSPFAHVLSRAVGTQPAVEVDTLMFEAVAGDRYVLCSDGLSNHLEDAEALAAEIGHDLDDAARDAAADALVAIANEGGGDDNITVVIVSVDGDVPEPERMTIVESRFDALRSMFMFEDLDRAMIARVMQMCRVDMHEEDDVVVEVGEDTQELLVVVGGRYELSDAEGVIGELGPGEYAGATTLIKARPSRARLRALEASRLLRLTGDAFTRLIRKRPWLGIYLLERLGNKLSNDLDRSYLQREGTTGEQVRIRERF